MSDHHDNPAPMTALERNRLMLGPLGIVVGVLGISLTDQSWKLWSIAGLMGICIAITSYTFIRIVARSRQQPDKSNFGNSEAGSLHIGLALLVASLMLSAGYALNQVRLGAGGSVSEESWEGLAIGVGFVLIAIVEVWPHGPHGGKRQPLPRQPSPPGVPAPIVSGSEPHRFGAAVLLSSAPHSSPCFCILCVLVKISLLS